MHRIALGLSAFLLVSVPATMSIAQQHNRLPEAPLLDCGYVCVFAQSTEPVQDLDQSAAVVEHPPQSAFALAQTQISQVIPANFAGVSRSGQAR
jgi:hypothetical protein